jgi:hypothetical protein
MRHTTMSPAAVRKNQQRMREALKLVQVTLELPEYDLPKALILSGLTPKQTLDGTRIKAELEAIVLEWIRRWLATEIK